MRIGIDIGGVIISRGRTAAEDTSFFSDNYLQTPEVESAIESIEHLNKYDRVFLVSKAGAKTAARSLEWLEHRDFFNQTGLTEEDIFFCKERSEKARIAEELKLDTFIDDRLEILINLPATVVRNRILLNPTPEEVSKHLHKVILPVTIIGDWMGIMEIFYP